MSAAWTPDKGWHDVNEAERRRMQRHAVRRILGERDARFATTPQATYGPTPLVGQSTGDEG